MAKAHPPDNSRMAQTLRIIGNLKNPQESIAHQINARLYFSATFSWSKSAAALRTAGRPWQRTDVLIPTLATGEHSPNAQTHHIVE
jgi:hypothetical protein